jgi:hypothetical protein
MKGATAGGSIRKNNALTAFACLSDTSFDRLRMRHVV